MFYLTILTVIHPPSLCRSLVFVLVGLPAARGVIVYALRAKNVNGNVTRVCTRYNNSHYERYTAQDIYVCM
jgi:hypothetical protein